MIHQKYYFKEYNKEKICKRLLLWSLRHVGKKILTQVRLVWKVPNYKNIINLSLFACSFCITILSTMILKTQSKRFTARSNKFKFHLMLAYSRNIIFKSINLETTLLGSSFSIMKLKQSF